MGTKILTFIVLSLTLTSCSRDGHMYKACYTTPNGWLNQNQTTKSVATNFFFREDKNDEGALEWYKKTEAYQDISTRCDSFWVEYWGTWEEWKEME